MSHEATAKGRPLRGMHILMVDDDVDTRDLLVVILVVSGATVEAASDGAEALLCIERRRPHILVSDITMPYEDGWSLMRKVKAMDPTIIGVAISSLPANAKARSLEAGFSDHISKPFDPRALVTQLVSLGGKFLQPPPSVPNG